VIQMLRTGPGEGEADVLLVLNGDLHDLHAHLPDPLDGARPWERVWSSTWDTPDEPVEEPVACPLTLEALSVEVFVSRRDGAR
jgi:glycogen operon protein